MIDLFGRGALIQELKQRVQSLERQAERDAEERRELYRVMEQNRSDFRAALDVIRNKPAAPMPQRKTTKKVPLWMRDVDWEKLGVDPEDFAEAER